MTPRWQWSRFAELSAAHLYDAMVLRQRVFVLEQNCLYVDADGRDRDAWHLFAWDETRPEAPALAAYLRVLPPGKHPEHAIGRVVTAPEYRARGLGRDLMNRALTLIARDLGPVPLRLAAQAHLEPFYRGLGFGVVSGIYDEDGIPHVDMVRPDPASTKASPASSK